MTLESDLSDKSDVSDKMGASRYTPWVCCAAVWFGSGEDVPLGYAVITVARHKEPAAVPTGKSVRDF